MLDSYVSRRASSLFLLTTATLRTVHSLLSTTNNISRATFLAQTTTSSLLALSPFSTATTTPNTRMDDAIALLTSVYGPIDSSTFPLSMPEDEAGLCANGQRRYLWTDAFGVMALVSIAEIYQAQNQATNAELYRRAANQLITVVHQSLGVPRSLDLPDAAMTRDSNSPTGYVGLRIGKVDSQKETDYGMRYDGQYWHYVDKWLLALARAGHVEDGIRIAKSCFPYFFDGTGIRWKLNVDASPPEVLQGRGSGVSDDDLVALIVFSILENARTTYDMPSLSKEIDRLKQILRGYRPRMTDDPLGWGLEAMYDQFLEGHPRRRSLAALHERALDPSHLSLPFRLYGAMIGARIAGNSVAPPKEVDKLIQMSLDYEARAEKRGIEEHSSINRVMLAMCLLCPGVLARRPMDPLITLD